jgi:hypothetical protein
MMLSPAPNGIYMSGHALCTKASPRTENCSTVFTFPSMLGRTSNFADSPVSKNGASAGFVTARCQNVPNTSNASLPIIITIRGGYNKPLYAIADDIVNTKNLSASGSRKDPYMVCSNAMGASRLFVLLIEPHQEYLLV